MAERRNEGYGGARPKVFQLVPRKESGGLTEKVNPDVPQTVGGHFMQGVKNKVHVSQVTGIEQQEGEVTGEQEKIGEIWEDLACKATTMKLSEKSKESEDSEQYQKWCKDRADKHVRTTLFHQVRRKLRQTKSVLLLADAGDGKSTLLQLVALQYGKDGFLTLEIKTPADINNYNTDGQNVLFVCDNLLGGTSINEHKSETWKDSENEEFPDHAKFLFACRLEFWGKKKADLCRKQIFNDIVVVRSDQLTYTDKKEMLDRHVGDRISEETKKIIAQTSGFSFPECCRFASQSSNVDFSDSNKLVEIFSNPFKFVMKQLETVEKNNKIQYAVLVFCLLNEGNFPKTSKSVVFKQSNFEEVRKLYLSDIMCSSEQLYDKMLGKVKEMDGWVLRQEGDNYKFYHDSIFEAMCRLHGDLYPGHILTFCEPKTAITVFTTTQCSDSDRVTLPPSCYKQLAEVATTECLKKDVRLWSDVWRFVFGHMNIDILKEFSVLLERKMPLIKQIFRRLFFRQHRAPTVDDVLMLMTELPDCYLKNMDDVSMCAAYHGDCGTVVSLIDSGVSRFGRVSGLQWAAMKGHTDVVRLIVERRDMDMEGVERGLYGAVWYNKVECVTEIVRARSDIDTDTIHRVLQYAVKCGRVLSVRELLKRPDIRKQTIQEWLDTDDSELFVSRVTRTVRGEIRTVLVNHLDTDS